VGTSRDTWGQMGTRRDKILEIFFKITENFSGDLGRGLYTFILSQGLDWT
jgi:hypothetical protein